MAWQYASISKRRTHGKTSVLSGKPVTERIIIVILQGAPMNIAVLALYAPVSPNGQTTAAAASDNFYIDLQRTVNTVATTNILLIIGDFNARVGLQHNHSRNNVVGPHTTGHINENGQRLLDFCSTNNLLISNTFFQHKHTHQTTWMHPGNKQWHTLDHTPVN